MTSEIIVLSRSELSEILRQNAVAVVAQLRNEFEQKPIPELMTKTELSAYLSCSISKIDYYMKKGLPTKYFGDTPRFRKIKIDEWLQAK